MAVKVAINGFGRIGRLAFRQMFGHEGSEIVAINDLTSPDMLAYLLKYDSTQGNYSRDHEIVAGESSITVDGIRISITIYKEADASNLPWGELGLTLCSSAPASNTPRPRPRLTSTLAPRRSSSPLRLGNDLPTIVYNVNHETLTADDNIISAASCTTNCLAPMAKGLNDFAPIVSGIMTTIHALDWRPDAARRPAAQRATSAAAALAPSTSSPTAPVLLRLSASCSPSSTASSSGAAQRVPTPTGSLTNLYAVVDKKVTVDEVNAAMKAYAATIPDTSVTTRTTSSPPTSSARPMARSSMLRRPCAPIWATARPSCRLFLGTTTRTPTPPRWSAPSSTSRSSLPKLMQGERTR